jgi:23S rRNA pseudouridine2605 synthase
VEKTYRATVHPPGVSERTLRALREGVVLEDGRTAPARVRLSGPGQLEVVLREGRKHQVRRMCEAVGHKVISLERVAFGPLMLGRLGLGDSRRLSAADEQRLRAAAGL